MNRSLRIGVGILLEASARCFANMAAGNMAKVAICRSASSKSSLLWEVSESYDYSKPTCDNYRCQRDIGRRIISCIVAFIRSWQHMSIFLVGFGLSGLMSPPCPPTFSCAGTMKQA